MLAQTKTIWRTWQGNWVVDLGDRLWSADDPQDCVSALRLAGWDVLSIEDVNDNVWEARSIPPSRKGA